MSDRWAHPWMTDGLCWGEWKVCVVWPAPYVLYSSVVRLDDGCGYDGACLGTGGLELG